MFRFTIRDVLWLTVVVAVLVGSWVRQADLSKELAYHKARSDEMRRKAGTEWYHGIMLKAYTGQSVQGRGLVEIERAAEGQSSPATLNRP